MHASESNDNESLVFDLQAARRRHRGDVLRATAEFECPNHGCPVRMVRVGFVEEHGQRVLQPVCRCPRCTHPMAYLGMQVGR